MKILTNIENLPEDMLTYLKLDLCNHGNCEVQRDGTETIVRCEGDLVDCMCAIAVCDRYKFAHLCERRKDGTLQFSDIGRQN